MTMRRMIGLTAAMAVMAMLPAHAAYARESGIQRTPDGARVLVSKDVGGQRYAITLNVADGTASGNVFGNDGSAPAFISCAPTGTSSFSCRVAPTCDPNAGRESGIQRAFDSEAVLVSKDVQGQRYAITQNTDGTLTGNVFFSATGAAKFLFCTPAGGGYTCALSDSCATLPCTSQYTTLQDPITLPATFFTLPESCRTYGDPIAVTLPRDFFVPDAEIMAAAARTAIVNNPYRTTQVATAEQLAKNATINDPILGSRVVNGPPKVGDVITCPTAGMQTLVSCTVDASGAFSSIVFDNCTVGSSDTGFIVQNGTVEVITNPPVCVLYTAGDLPLGVAAREQHRNFETSFFTGPGVRTEVDLENVGADVLYGNQCPGVDSGFTSRVYSGILGTNRTTTIDIRTGNESAVA